MCAMAETRGDEELLARAAEGDEGALAVLVGRYQRRVVGFLAQMLGDVELARDLTQEVFVRVWGAASTFNPRYRFTTWLFRIAHNLAIDHLRKRRLATTSLHSVSGDGEEQTLQLPAKGKDPLGHLENRELAGALRRAIGELKEDYRELVLLRHFALLSYQEIADLKGMPLGTVKNKLFRAHSVLREALAGYRQGRASK
jgi:RNA polymerase sigma-70 factor (ECF subfamily)